MFQSEIQLSTLISTLDWIVFFSVLLITLSAIVYGNLKKNDSTPTAKFIDLMLMGRRLTLPMFTATLVATWYGGIFGVTRIAFEQGIYNFLTQGVFWYLTYLIFAFFIVDKLSASQAITLPDLVGKMFGPKASKISAVFNFFNVLPIAYTISMGILIQNLFSISFTSSMFLGVTLVILYSLSGGFRAVVFSDLVQFFVMCTGVFLILLLSIFQFGGPSFLIEQLPKEHWHLTGTVGLGTTLAWGFIALSTLVDPNFYQRCFAARSPRVAKRGIIISTLIWFCFDICTTFGAMYAKAVIPEAAPEGAYLTYAMQLLPSGLKGLVLAGILATILSTLDSYLFLAGVTLSFDLAPKKWKKRIFLHHIGIICVGLLSILMGLIFQGNIKMVWKTLGSYSAACLLLPVLYGHFYPQRTHEKQFLLACALGFLGVSLWAIIPLSDFWANIDKLYVGMALTGIGLAVYRPKTF